MGPWSFDLGTFDEHTIDSQALRGNALGDPHERPFWVYLPPGYDDDPDARYPSVYVIQGLTGQLDMWRNRSPFRRNFPELADDLFAARRGAARASSSGWTAGPRSAAASSSTRPAPATT